MVYRKDTLLPYAQLHILSSNYTVVYHFFYVKYSISYE